MYNSNKQYVLRNSHPHDLVQPIGRPGVILTFVNAMSPLTLNDCLDETKANGSIKKGISPARIIKPYGMNVNFSINTETRHEGADGSIEEAKLDSMLAVTEYCLHSCMTGVVDNDSDTVPMPEEFKVPINYVTSNMMQDRGLDALSMAKKYSMQDCLEAISNLSKKGGQRNLTQAQALQAAALAVFAYNNSLNGKSSIAEEIVADSNAFQNDFYNYSMNHKDAITSMVPMLMNQKMVNILKYNLKNTASAKSSGVITIYKAFKTPHPYQTDANGLTDGYDLSIVFNAGKSSPIHVELVTMKGKPLQNRAVGMTPDKSSMKTFQMDISMEEWYSVISAAVAYKNALKAEYMENARNIETVLDWINRNPNQNPTPEMQELMSACQNPVAASVKMNQMSQQIGMLNQQINALSQQITMLTQTLQYSVRQQAC
jgi:hypothetical protein